MSLFVGIMMAFEVNVVRQAETVVVDEAVQAINKSTPKRLDSEDLA
jgi:hypothetical protein